MLFCGGENHKQNDCKKETSKCLNCGEQHRTLAASCPVRKELIKEKRISIRDRSRSRSQQRQAIAQAQLSSTTYAGKTSQKVPSFFQGLDKDEMKRMVTVIMSSIFYSHYMEAQYKGTFQKNMDIIFKKNNLHSVKFPDLIRTKGIKDIFENIEAETEDPFVSTEELSREDPSVRRKEMESEKVREEPMETGETQKRMRERTTPSPQEEKAKEKKKKESRKKETEHEPSTSEIDTKQQQQPYRQRTDSTSSISWIGKVQLKTKDLGIKVYVPPVKTHRRIFSTPLNEKKKEQVIQNMLKGYGTFTYLHSKINQEVIIEGFKNKRLNLNETEFKMLIEKDYKELEEKLKEKTTRKSSSTSYLS